MNYTWEAALAADRAGIPREKITYRPVRNGSPYAEVVLENLNSRDVEEIRHALHGTGIPCGKEMFADRRALRIVQYGAICGFTDTA